MLTRVYSESGSTRELIEGVNAPSTTVGGGKNKGNKGSSSDTHSTAQSGSDAEGLSDTPTHGAPAQPPQDIDVELGYPAAQIIEYWRRKERLHAQTLRYEPTAQYIPVSL